MQTVFAACKLFEEHERSCKYHQPVVIIMNEVDGSADLVLASFKTVLNCKAIIVRLNFTNADKRLVYLTEQEMLSLGLDRQSIVQFYDTVEKNLTLIINKRIMIYEGNNSLIESLGYKYRQDALRIFILGLNIPICEVLFSFGPVAVPTALALAQQLEANQTRYLFVSSFTNRGNFTNRFTIPFNGSTNQPQNSSHCRRVPNMQSQSKSKEISSTESHYNIC